jgi:hypothetical protein
MEELSRVLFHMNTDEIDPLDLAINLDFYISARRQREFILGNLVPFGKVRVKIVLPGELAVGCNLTVGGQRGPYRIFDNFLVEDRETSRKAGAYRTGMGVRLSPKESRAPAENLTPGQKLGMNLKAYYRFIFHGTLHS